MKEEIIDKYTSGQRLDKYLKKYLSKAPKSFIYKMLRKKNIVLNGKKSAGNEILSEGDKVKLFLADETIEKFSLDGTYIDRANGSIDIVFEDENFILINKPKGMLSQKADKGDISAAEEIISYLISSSAMSKDDLKVFKPGTANRLDRNTSGLLAAGKNLKASQFLAEGFRDRSLEKIYLALVKGEIHKDFSLCGYLTKDHLTNKVIVTDKKQKGSSKIETNFFVVSSKNNLTLLKIHLVTGKTHQIRAHLSSVNHPIVGDNKYGDENFNREFRNKYKLKSQLLHAMELTFPVDVKEFKYLAGKTFKADIPEELNKILKDKGFNI